MHTPARPLPGMVRFALWERLAAMAQDGVVPQIVGLHSVCFDGETVDVLFDVSPPSADGAPLHIQFPRPVFVAPDPEEVRDFCIWLAASEQGGVTVH